MRISSALAAMAAAPNSIAADQVGVVATASSTSADHVGSCHAVPNMGVTDAWCQASCPSNCPAALCTCGSLPAAPVAPPAIAFVLTGNECNPCGAEYPFEGGMDETTAWSTCNDGYDGWLQRRSPGTGGFNYHYTGPMSLKAVGEYDTCEKQAVEFGIAAYSRNWTGATFLGYKNVSLEMGPTDYSYGAVQECEHWAFPSVGIIQIPIPAGPSTNTWATVKEVFLLPPETAPAAPGSAPQTNWSRIRAVTFWEYMGHSYFFPCTDPQGEEPWDGTNCSTNQLIGAEETPKPSFDVPELCEGCCAGCPSAFPNFSFPGIQTCTNTTGPFDRHEAGAKYTGRCALPTCEIFPATPPPAPTPPMHPA